jgi:predicted nucleic acid-binding protein
MTTYVIDAYAWAEYFAGSSLGEKVKAIVEDENNIIQTNVITIAELASHFSRNKKEFDEAKKILLSLSTIYQISIEFSSEAGLLHTELRKERKHIRLADVFALLTARKLQAKVVTGDQDFKGLKGVLMLS